jgi:hypothetical protein
VTTENIFTGQDKAQEAAAQSATPPETQGSGEIVSALVGDGQKYKTVDELAKAYLHADTFIQQLKEENQKYREQAAAAKSIDDVLERLQQAQQPEPVTPVKAEQPDISALVEQTLAQREAKKAQEANLLEADRLMKERHGERATELFKAKASTPELKKLYVDLASRSPQDFVALFGEPQASGSSIQTGSSVNTVNVASHGMNRENVEGTKEWFSKMRKDEPQKFYSSAMQVRFSRAATDNPKLYFG